jgi:uncharacterized membrane protein YbhN (UPF0104 family)
MSFKWQVGQFFLVVGVLLLILYFITNQAKNPTILYFCGGTLMLILGIYMMWLGRNPPLDRERFRMLRQMSEKRKKPKKEKKSELE